MLVYFWLFWVFVATHRLSLVLASGGCSLVAVVGLLIVVVSLVWYEGSGHRLSCSTACGIFLDQGSKVGVPKVDSKLLDHQGSPNMIIIKEHF